MLISYYANKKSSPRLPSWQPSLIFFNIPIESGTIKKPCTLKHFQVTYMLHKAGYWTIMDLNLGLPQDSGNHGQWRWALPSVTRNSSQLRSAQSNLDSIMILWHVRLEYSTSLTRTPGIDGKDGDGDGNFTLAVLGVFRWDCVIQQLQKIFQSSAAPLRQTLRQINQNNAASRRRQIADLDNSIWERPGYWTQ